MNMSDGEVIYLLLLHFLGCILIPIDNFTIVAGYHSYTLGNVVAGIVHTKSDIADIVLLIVIQFDCALRLSVKQIKAHTAIGQGGSICKVTGDTILFTTQVQDIQILNG